jgi:hypothetical protein
MKKTVTSIFVCLASLSLAACGAATSKPSVSTIYTANGPVTYAHPAHDSTVLEKIIGTNDLEPVLQNGANIPSKYSTLIDAFGLISMGCTATHIGNGLVLTAGHCFNGPAKRGSQADCSKWVIQWGLRKDATPYLVSRCKEILAYELNDDRDYAIFTVDNAPSAYVEVDLTEKPANGAVITIFGHPQARPLEWSKTCVVEPGSKGKWGADEFSHQCDTEPGNSGSTIIDDTTLKVVGIHDGGRAPWNYGTYLLSTPIAEYANQLPY